MPFDPRNTSWKKRKKTHGIELQNHRWSPVRICRTCCWAGSAPRSSGPPRACSTCRRTSARDSTWSAAWSRTCMPSSRTPSPMSPRTRTDSVPRPPRRKQRPARCRSARRKCTGARLLGAIRPTGRARIWRHIWGRIRVRDLVFCTFEIYILLVHTDRDRLERGGRGPGQNNIWGSLWCTGFVCVCVSTHNAK